MFSSGDVLICAYSFKSGRDRHKCRYAQRRVRLRQSALAGAHAVARIGNRGAAEIKRTALPAQHHFHHIRIHKFIEIVDSCAAVGHRRAVFHQHGCGLVNQFRVNQRLVALHVHHHGVGAEAQQLRGFGQVGGAARVILPSSPLQYCALGRRQKSLRDRWPPPHARRRLLAACSAARTTMGLPWISASALRGSREDDMRAGINTTKPLMNAAPRRSIRALRFEHKRYAVFNRISKLCFGGTINPAGLAHIPMRLCTRGKRGYREIFFPLRFFLYFS